MSTEQQPSGTKRNWQEELTATGDELVGRVRDLVKEGNVRRVIIKHDDRTLLELPLTLGVVGALLAPQVAALGALAALVSRCSITIEREEDDSSPTGNAPPRLNSPSESPPGSSDPSV